MASGHGVPKPNTAHHPKRKVGREDYYTNTVADAAAYERNNAPQMSDADLRRQAMGGGPGARQAWRDLGEYDYD